MKTAQRIQSGLEFIPSEARLFCLMASLFFLIGASSEVYSVSLTANDSSNATSFNEAGNWSDGLAPSAGKAYETSKVLRTPADSTEDFTFLGDSLTILSGGSLVFKGKSTSTVTPTITVGNLILKGGFVANQYTGQTFILAGNIQLTSGYTSYFTINSINQGYTVSSIISGSGALTVKVNSTLVTSQLTQESYGVTFASSNTWTGGLTIDTYSYVTATTANALGVGNVRVNGGMLMLQDSSAIADTATLTIASGLTGSTIALYFSDTMQVSALSLNGGSTYLSSGTYSISDLNTLYGSNIFIGDGITDSAMIQVIPEPTTVSLVIFGVCLLVVACSKKQTITC